METDQADEVSLSELPDPCLLAVLQCCAAIDQRSVLSAARAHSRLHQAAVLALRSITAVVKSQEQVNSVLLYLSKHGQHLDSVSIEDEHGYHPLTLHLPTALTVQLRSLQLKEMLLVGEDFRGVLGPTLTQLQLKKCRMLGNATVDALAASLSQLVGLEHLSLTGSWRRTGNECFKFPTAVLQQLQRLTYLQLKDVHLLGPDDGSPTLQPLQGLTRLQDLRVKEVWAGRGNHISITASMLSGAHHLTRLHVDECEHAYIEPAVLAGKTRLQHLQMIKCGVYTWQDEDNFQLMSQLQPLQLLTHLDLTGTFYALGQDDGAVYAALSASSRLQHLNISGCSMPDSAWRHIFPTGLQLTQLRELIIMNLNLFAAPNISRIARCCPELQSLNMRGLPYSAELLAPLQGLSGLHTLRLDDWQSAKAEGLQGLCQLTGLRELSVELHMQNLTDVAQRVCEASFDSEDWRLLLKLTQLQQLTALELNEDYEGGTRQGVTFIMEVSKCHLHSICSAVVG
jgi:hypothetical protein